MRKGFEQNKTFNEITRDAQNDWNTYEALSAFPEPDVHPDDIPAEPVRDIYDDIYEARERVREQQAENIGEATIIPDVGNVTPVRTRSRMGVNTTLNAMRSIYEDDPIGSPLPMAPLEEDTEMKEADETGETGETGASEEEEEEEDPVSEEEEETSEEEEVLPIALRRPRRKRAKPRRLGFE